MSGVRLRAYSDGDLALTVALESDPEVMAELGGPRGEADLREAHRRRVDDPWWLVIVDTGSGEGLGAIGVWDGEHEGETVHETGWLVLPRAQGRGVASAALDALIRRVRAANRFPALDAFPAVNNAPSNRLCDKFGFEALGVCDVVFAGRTLRCNHRRLAVAR